MSAGYVAVTIIFFVLALGVCLLAYRYYTRLSFKTMPLNCAFWQALSLYVCVVPFPLLVMDIDAALYARDTGAPSQTWMRPIWITIFAVSYWCAWITLPVAQMYTEVGEFTYKGRLIHSIKLNLKLYGAIVSIILIVFVYLLILKGAYTSTARILKIAISLANTWGLLILTLFMPAGLVGVPRMLWRNADARKLLRRRLFDVIDIQEDLDLAAMDLSAVKSELISIDPLVSDENRPHLGEMLELIATTDREVPQYHIAAQRVRAVPSEDRNDISLEHLELLHAKLKRSIKIVRRASYRWTSTVRECQTLDAIIAGPDSTNNQMKRIWYTIRTYVYWAGFGVTTFLTLVILWSELVLPFRQLSSKPLGLVEVIMHSSVHFVASIIFLFYMAYCAYWAAFQFKVFDVYVIYPDIADNASLCFNECFLVRLLMPLCFNFLLISGLSAASTGVDVEYGHVYRRNMDISMLFGEWFNRFLPALIPFLSIIVFFNLAQRLLSLVGVEVHDPNDVESPSVRQRILDGKRLVEIDVGHELTASVLPDGDGETTIVPGFTTAPAAPAPPMERGQRYKEYLAKKERKDDDEP